MKLVSVDDIMLYAIEYYITQSVVLSCLCMSTKTPLRITVRELVKKCKVASTTVLRRELILLLMYKHLGTKSSLTSSCISLTLHLLMQVKGFDDISFCAAVLYMYFLLCLQFAQHLETRIKEAIKDALDASLLL